MNEQTQVNQVRELDEKKVVVGLTGGHDSTITAFLLKKQGYRCIGLAIVILSDELDIPALKGLPLCRVEDLEKIKGICKRLEIPFYAVNLKAEFFDSVIDMFIASKLVGTQYSLIPESHRLLIDVLREKADKLGAAHIATGHYAKVHFHQERRFYYVHMANEIKSDQSHYLSRCSQKGLERLKLPLGDSRREEVLRIVENFTLGSVEREDIREQDYYYSEDLSEFVSSRSDPWFKGEGSFVDVQLDVSKGDHGGIFEYSIGQGQITSKISGQMIDKALQVVKIDPVSKTIYLGPETMLVTNNCYLRNIFFCEGMDISKCKDVGVKFNHTGETMVARFYPKNNNCALLELSGEANLLAIKQSVTIYNKIGKAAQVYGVGEIASLGTYDTIHRCISVIDPETDEHGDPVPVIGADFAF